MTILLDTNVLSELLRSAPAPTVLAWFARQPAESLFISAVTQAEMLLGARLLPPGKRRERLQGALNALFLEEFGTRTWSFDAPAAASYVDVVSARRAAGHPVSQFDAQIAAIAVSRNAGLATRNTRDFEGCGLHLTDPWAKR